MNIIKNIGLILFIIAFGIFTLSLGIGNFTLTEDSLKNVENKYHKEEILKIARSEGVLNKDYSSRQSFLTDFKEVLVAATESLEKKVENGLPEGVKEGEVKLGSGKYQDYTVYTIKHSTTGIIADKPLLFLLLTFILGAIGALLYNIPK